jgi:hypothetical protein
VIYIAEQNEILLTPRLDIVRVDDSKLQTDIKSLANKINSKEWLKLSVSIDDKSLKAAIDNISKTDLPKLTLDTIIDTSKLSKNIQTALKAIKTSDINLDIGTKTNSTSKSASLGINEAEVARVAQEVEKLQGKIERTTVSWSKMMSNQEISNKVKAIQGSLKNFTGDSNDLKKINRESNGEKSIGRIAKDYVK